MDTLIIRRWIRCMLILGIISAGGTSLSAQALLTMERALDIAEENSPDMKQTELALVRSQERLNAQRARLKSQFSITLDPFQYEKTNRFDQQTSEWYLNESASSGGTFAINQRILPTDGQLMLVNRFSYDYSFTESAFASDPISKTFNNNLYLQFSQPIFTYNRTKMETESLELEYESSLLRYLLMRLALERNVAQQFFAVYSNQMSLEIAREEFTSNQESYNIIKNKVEGGLLALEELYQAEVNLAISNSGVFTAELTLENSKDQFKVLIGLSLDTTLLIAAEIIADTVPVNQELAISHALENRMELREREIDIQNANFNLTQAKATNEFAGSITASFGLQSYDEQFGSMFDTPTNTPAIGISFDIPLFDWGERKSEIKAAEASLQSSQLGYEIESTDIVVNIRSVVRNLKNLENQIQIQRKTVENATLAYDINLERYRNGDLTSLDLGMYQTQLSEAKMAVTNAIIDYKIELLNLKIQTLYDFEKGLPIIPEEFKSSKNEK
ncbi:MAG: TolC family protein [Bacteroidia bacterium]|nr:MAG: TolC family protein [Bacteroidia bacterium]